MLLIYRLAGVIPVPGIDLEAVNQAMSQFSLLNFMSVMTGGQLSQMTVMAMGISPYINASIVMQLLQVAIPYLENLSKSGEDGRKKIAQYQRYATVVLAFIQAVGLVMGMGAMRASYFSPFITGVLIGLSMSAGTALAMWIGERISENGIGNGISLLIFAGIISSLFKWAVSGIVSLFTTAVTVSGILTAVLVIIGILVMIVAVTYVDMGERRVLVQYSKRVVGRKMYGGQSTHIPMKVNASGVLPLIFAHTIFQFPSTIMGFWPNSGIANWWSNAFMPSIWYQLVLAVAIIFFAYFYSSISFNPVDIAKNMQQNGGTIPGIRQGKPTSDHLQRISNRITLFGGIFLAVLSTIPTLA